MPPIAEKGKGVVVFGRFLALILVAMTAQPALAAAPSPEAILKQAY